MRFTPTSLAGATALAPMPKRDEAFARVRTATGPGRFLWLGDSTVAGFLSGAIANNAPTQLAAQLNRNTIGSTVGLIFANAAVPADGRVTVGAGWSVTTQLAMGAGWWQSANGAAGSLTFTIPHDCDRIRVLYLRNVGHGSTTPTVDGNAQAAINANGAIAMQQVTWSVPSGSGHVVAFPGATGGILFVAGVEGWLSGLPAMTVTNGGRTGYQASNLITNTNPYDMLPMITQVGPDVTCVQIGINDAGLQVPVDLFISRVRTVGEAIKAAGSDLIISAPIPSQNAPWSTFETAYAPALRTLATQLGARFYNPADRWGTWAQANARGLMADALHPSPLGYADHAAAIAGVLTAP